MPQDYFNQRKKTVLEKQDKSSIGSWDKKIKKLCELINKKQEYYTTSSCSGRIVLMIDQEKKAQGLFLSVWHDRISFMKLKQEIDKLIKKESKKLNVKFKQEPVIFHVACKTIEDAKSFLVKAREIGFKRGGIISITRECVVIELLSTEKLEFPLIQNGKILVNDDFLKIVLKKANKNLEKGWDKIIRLEKRV